MKRTVKLYAISLLTLIANSTLAYSNVIDSAEFFVKGGADVLARRTSTATGNDGGWLVGWGFKIWPNEVVGVLLDVDMHQRTWKPYVSPASSAGVRKSQLYFDIGLAPIFKFGKGNWHLEYSPGVFGATHYDTNPSGFLETMDRVPKLFFGIRNLVEVIYGINPEWRTGLSVWSKFDCTGGIRRASNSTASVSKEYYQELGTGLILHWRFL